MLDRIQLKPAGLKTLKRSILLAVLSIFISSVAAVEKQKRLHKYEYAIFYMETEGDFVVPVEVDAPFVYSWSDPNGSVKGDIPEIWRYLKLQSDVDYSYVEIESKLVNHVAKMGWELHDLEITSVPIINSNSRFRTAYRYVFRRSSSLSSSADVP